MDDDRRRRRVIRVPDLSGMIHSIVAPEWYDDDDLLCQIREQMARYEAAKPDTGERPCITLNEVGL